MALFSGRCGRAARRRTVAAYHLYYCMTPLLSRLRDHLARRRLFAAGGTAVVAVSGGPDSVALLDLVHSLAPELGLALVVAHADHGIQADSSSVGQAVAALARRYGLPFDLGELHLGPVEPVTARGLPVHDDPANRDPRHLRSWVRTVLLPLVSARLGEGARADLARAGRAAALERRAWDRVLRHLPELGLRLDEHGFDVARGGVAGYDNALAVAVLRAAARRAGLVLGPRRARQLVRLARRPSGRRLELGGGWAAEVAFDRLRVRGRTREVGRAGAREVEVVREVVEVVADEGRGCAQFGEFRLEWSAEVAPERLARGDWTTWIAGGAWEVRPLRPGDALVPLGGIGHRPVRRLLMDARVSRSDRAQYA